MAIPASDQRRLCMKSGGRCAFGHQGEICRRRLTLEVDGDELVVLGEMAHIVAERPNGPRGDSPMTLEERNRYENLILMCNVHHQLIDDAEHTFTVQRLRAMKLEHEAWVDKRLGVADAEPLAEAMVSDRLHSTMLPVLHMPKYIYGVELSGTRESAIKGLIDTPRNGEMTPFIVFEGRLWAFQSLKSNGNPFKKLVGDAKVLREKCEDWWDDDILGRWFAYLLNRCLNKLTGRKGLNWDREHRRYYFYSATPGEPLSIDYTPLNRTKVSRDVVWRPIRKKTGVPRNYWLHRAVSLQFMRVTGSDWILTLRPEFRVTRDGVASLESSQVGRRVTRKLAKQFNDGVLTEIQFWRDFLSANSPRILLPFHDQYIEISSEMTSCEIVWPGIPAEHALKFANTSFGEDLFSWSNKHQAAEASELLDEDDFDEGEVEDIDNEGDDNDIF